MLIVVWTLRQTILNLANFYDMGADLNWDFPYRSFQRHERDSQPPAWQVSWVIAEHH